MKKNLKKTVSLALLATLCITSNANADEKLRKIVLDNNTDADRHIKVYDTNGEKLFDKDVGDDKKFTIRGKGDKGALGDEIDIHLDGEYYTTISTGCTHVKLWDEIDLLEVEEIATIPCKDDNSKDDYDEGWDDGYDPGFEEGKDDVCKKKAHKIDEEFDDDGIYDKGWEKGYTYGYEKGWKSCDEDEEKDKSSYDDGWDAGYHPGAEEAQADVCAEKSYQIDEEFSDESHYDKGWEKGYRKGYDYFYKKGECKITSTTNKLTGININWSFLPKLDTDIVDATASLSPKIIRYPGGTISKTWSWESGTTSKGNREPHTLDDLLHIQKATNTKVTFVLNTIHKTLENQLELLRTAKSMGIPIEYIEMGNEHYLGKGGTSDDSGKHQDNVVAFPSGTEYAEFINSWSPAIRKEFPNAKIGISMFARISSDERKNRWNDLIVETVVAENFDAYIYHIYVSPEDSIELNDNTIATIIKERMNVYESVKVDDASKEIWITEYGVHTDTIDKTVILTEALADYIEATANIALPQVLYTKSDTSLFSMLKPPYANGLTALGKMFSERWQ